MFGSQTQWPLPVRLCCKDVGLQNSSGSGKNRACICREFMFWFSLYTNGVTYVWLFCWNTRYMLNQNIVGTICLHTSISAALAVIWCAWPIIILNTWLQCILIWIIYSYFSVVQRVRSQQQLVLSLFLPSILVSPPLLHHDIYAFNMRSAYWRYVLTIVSVAWLQSKDLLAAGKKWFRISVGSHCQNPRNASLRLYDIIIHLLWVGAHWFLHSMTTQIFIHKYHFNTLMELFKTTLRLSQVLQRFGALTILKIHHGTANPT